MIPIEQKLNIFTQAAGGRASIHSEAAERMMLMMSTYEEFMIILAVAGLIVSILDLWNQRNKK